MQPNYKNLIVWQKSVDLVVVIYQLTELYPRNEIYGLVSQMRRAAVSVPSNIAEDRRRSGINEFNRFLSIAFASGGELETQIEISKRLPFSANLDFSKAGSILDEVMRMLSKLMQKKNNFVGVEA